MKSATISLKTRGSPSYTTTLNWGSRSACPAAQRSSRWLMQVSKPAVMVSMFSSSLLCLSRMSALTFAKSVVRAPPVQQWLASARSGLPSACEAYLVLLHLSFGLRFRRVSTGSSL